MIKHKSVHILLVGIVVLLTQLMFGSVLAQNELTSVTITATADGITVPETIAAGWVEITFANTSEIPFFSIIGHLDDDATMDEFMEALMGMMGGDASMTPPATFIGSPTAMPDTSWTATYILEAGTYILLSVAGEEPEIATFEVEGDVIESDFEPESDLTIALVDFAFGLPAELPTGEQTWLIENIGEQWHEMIFIPVPDGTTLEEALPMLMAMGGEGETEADTGGMPEFAMVWSPMGSEEKAWVQVNLAPGTYLVSCFIEDVNSDEHAIHAALGMMQIVTVTATGTYTDSNGMFTVDYPAVLTTIRPDLAREFGLPFPSVAFADSEETLNLSTAAQLVPEGGWGIAAMFIPEAFFTAMGIPEDAPLNDRAMVFSPQEGNAEGLVVAAINEITLANGAQAIQAEGAGETEDTYVVFTQVGDGLYVMVSMISAPGGRTAEMVDGLMTVVNGIKFTGTLEDIMAGMGDE